MPLRPIPLQSGLVATITITLTELVATITVTLTELVATIAITVTITVTVTVTVAITVTITARSTPRAFHGIECRVSPRQIAWWKRAQTLFGAQFHRASRQQSDGWEQVSHPGSGTWGWTRGRSRSGWRRASPSLFLKSLSPLFIEEGG